MNSTVEISEVAEEEEELLTLETPEVATIQPNNPSYLSAETEASNSSQARNRIPLALWYVSFICIERREEN